MVRRPGAVKRSTLGLNEALMKIAKNRAEHHTHEARRLAYAAGHFNPNYSPESAKMYRAQAHEHKRKAAMYTRRMWALDGPITYYNPPETRYYGIKVGKPWAGKAGWNPAPAGIRRRAEDIINRSPMMMYGRRGGDGIGQRIRDRIRKHMDRSDRWIDYNTPRGFKGSRA